MAAETVDGDARAYGYDAAGRQAGKSKAGEAWAYGYDHAGQNQKCGRPRSE